jgi:hemoglobin-like flavoprotein
LSNDIRESFGRCLMAPNFLGRFYELFFASHPEVIERFRHTDMRAQQALLRNGLSMMLMFEDGKPIAVATLERLGRTHGPGGMAIPPALYRYWVDSLLQAVRECDPKADAALEGRWRASMERGISFMVQQGTAPGAAAGGGRRGQG